MNLNNLLQQADIDPTTVLVFRHRPSDPKLNEVIPWLVAYEPDMFNAYQQTQTSKVEKAMLGAKYVASFIRHNAGKALFVGLYEIGPQPRPLSEQEYWEVPAYKRMREMYGMKGWTNEEGRAAILWFDLHLQDFRSNWIGKLIVDWPPPERSWWRRAHRNNLSVAAILEESALEGVMPSWDTMSLRWEQLAILPKSWAAPLSQWRGIYYIFDARTGKGYVGSAAGAENILGRWRNYAESGHGGNKLLRELDPKSFKFSILQRVSPDMDSAEIVRLESSWKTRLHTHAPEGLNDN